jgi:hypothetical protein
MFTTIEAQATESFATLCEAPVEEGGAVRVTELPELAPKTLRHVGGGTVVGTFDF